MTRLARSARGLLVALAALALTGGAVLAARSLPSAASTGTQHASTVSGQTVPAAGGVPASHDGADDEDTTEQAETPDAEDQDSANGDRPQNHGWFVSQAANAETPAGFDNHGAYVSSIAKGDDGKTGASTTGASTTGDTKSAKGKARAAAAKAAHQD